jgi:hypothetical protein
MHRRFMHTADRPATRLAETACGTLAARKPNMLIGKTMRGRENETRGCRAIAWTPSVQRRGAGHGWGNLVPKLRTTERGDAKAPQPLFVTPPIRKKSGPPHTEHTSELGRPGGLRHPPFGDASGWRVDHYVVSGTDGEREGPSVPHLNPAAESGWKRPRRPQEQRPGQGPGQRACGAEAASQEGRKDARWKRAPAARRRPIRQRRKRASQK